MHNNIHACVRFEVKNHSAGVKTKGIPYNRVSTTKPANSAGTSWISAMLTKWGLISGETLRWDENDPWGCLLYSTIVLSVDVLEIRLSRRSQEIGIDLGTLCIAPMQRQKEWLSCSLPSSMRVSIAHNYRIHTKLKSICRLWEEDYQNKSQNLTAVNCSPNSRIWQLTASWYSQALLHSTAMVAMAQ